MSQCPTQLHFATLAGLQADGRNLMHAQGSPGVKGTTAETCSSRAIALLTAALCVKGGLLVLNET